MWYFCFVSATLLTLASKGGVSCMCCPFVLKLITKKQINNLKAFIMLLPHFLKRWGSLFIWSTERGLRLNFSTCALCTRRPSHLLAMDCWIVGSFGTAQTGGSGRALAQKSASCGSAPATPGKARGRFLFWISRFCQVLCWYARTRVFCRNNWDSLWLWNITSYSLIRQRYNSF